MGGAFQTSREIFSNPIWQDVAKFRIFFFIVGNAVFSDEGVRVGNVVLKRGQYLRSYRNLQSDLEYIENRAIKKYSLSVLKRKIEQLVLEERLKIEDTELGTLFTVVNYAVYQGFDHYKVTTKNSVGTALEQRENSERTGMEQGWNNNNKDNKEKKDKKDNKVNNNINPFDFYQQNFGVLSPFNAQDIEQWIDDLNETLVIEAMKIAASDNKGWKYATGILKDWHKHRLQTLQDVEAHNLKFKATKQTGGKSLFEQGEESRKRQAAAEKEMEDKEIDWDKELEGLPY
jgi:DnaD/phage-associated family protein